MHNIIPLLLVILGLIGLIILFSRQKSEKEMLGVGEMEKDVFTRKELKKIKTFKLFFQIWEKVFLKIFNKENARLIGKGFLNFLEKFLIRLRIVILRIEQSLSKSLAAVKDRKIKKAEDEKSSFDYSVLKEETEEKNIEFPDNSFIDSPEEELRLLKEYLKKNSDLVLLKNLARWYLWKENFSFARWILIEAYHLDADDKIVQALLVELKENEEKTDSNLN